MTSPISYINSQVNNRGADPGTNATYAFTPGAGSTIMFVILTAGSALTPTLSTYNGVAMTNYELNQGNGGGIGATSVWYVVNPGTVAANVVFQWEGARYPLFWTMTFRNVRQNGPVYSVTYTAGGRSSPPQGQNVVTVSADHYAMELFSVGEVTDNTNTAQSGQTKVQVGATSQDGIVNAALAHDAVTGGTDAFNWAWDPTNLRYWATRVWLLAPARGGNQVIWIR